MSALHNSGGLSKGTITDFLRWFDILKTHFRTYELELTFDTDSETKEVPFLDIDMFKEENSGSIALAGAHHLVPIRRELTYRNAL